MPPPVLPAVTAGAVKSTVEGEQTSDGLAIVKLGVVFTVTVTASISVQPDAVVDLI